MSDISAIFGTLVFDDRVMRERLSPEAYNSLHRTSSGRSPKLIIDNKALADEIADAMKQWAVENGATHYTHWFQPLNGVTAEKHNSFVMPDGHGGALISFSGKELIKGESDASSFPSGGLRSTFEARGYTAWDPTSYAFIKDRTLCIPTVFFSYGGEALDKKTPLMRSSQALNREAIRVLRLLGDDKTSRIVVNAGAEQEYFLIDRKLYDRRCDLIFTGRTLLGARPPKGQELDDHYYGAIKPRVQAFMSELNEELWKLGICAKTEHNEAAPSQHELAPIFSTVNTATDQNQLIMEIMKRVAIRHGFVCVLHEKPFEGVNGSGKHNNWSIGTDLGYNLLEAGETPADNMKFMLFLCAVIRAVDDYQDLLRISVATAGNDCRLGSSEAPPAIISIYVGDELNGALEAILNGEKAVAHTEKKLETHVHVLPKLPLDSTDRNRTSPFAFTGNKFEFRMPGSSASIADPNTVLNTIVAESLRVFADRLEGTADIDRELSNIIFETVRDHGRIIFNGNNYTDEWVKEAARRGLLNLATTADAVPRLTDEKNIALFERHSVFTESELRSRCEILLEEYRKKVDIEALTMADMIGRELLPAAYSYIGELGVSQRGLREMNISVSTVQNSANKIAEICEETQNELSKLIAISSADHGRDALEAANYVKDIML
ncbi:MAG: glutamine synthetase III, partial [Clostridia bacterium]|nr:glutamine synthetase III [Clostridia bacterium]